MNFICKRRYLNIVYKISFLSDKIPISVCFRSWVLCIYHFVFCTESAICLYARTKCYLALRLSVWEFSVSCERFFVSLFFYWLHNSISGLLIRVILGGSVPLYFSMYKAIVSNETVILLDEVRGKIYGESEMFKRHLTISVYKNATKH